MFPINIFQIIFMNIFSFKLIFPSDNCSTFIQAFRISSFYLSYILLYLLFVKSLLFLKSNIFIIPLLHNSEIILSIIMSRISYLTAPINSTNFIFSFPVCSIINSFPNIAINDITNCSYAN